MRKAYSYIRMSTDIQLKGDSLRRQLKKTSAYAKEHGFELVDSIDGKPLRDIGVSGYRGKNAKTGALGSFLEALKDGKIEKGSVLLVENLDRISREQPSDAMALFMGILAHGMEIITTCDSQHYTKERINKEPSSLMIMIGIIIRGNEESVTKSGRIGEAWEIKRQNASIQPMTSVCPGWLRFSKKTKKFQVIPEHVEVVKKIFSMCADTCGLYGIAKHLNESGTPPFGRAKLWHRSYVHKILTNRSVLGEFQPKKRIDGKPSAIGELIPNYYPQIILNEEFHLANAAIDRRNTGNRGRKGAEFSNLFSGLVFCGSCGGKMAMRNRGKLPKGGRYLVCNNQLLHAGCTMPEWRLDEFETTILKHLHEVDFTSLLANQNSPLAELDNSIADIQHLLLTKEKRLKRQTEMAYDDDFSPESKSKFITDLNLTTAEIGSLESALRLKQQQRAAHIESESLLGSTLVKELIAQLESQPDDYLFRSSVNQILSKSIARIYTVKEKAPFMASDFSEQDAEVNDYRLTAKKREKLTFDELVNRPSFKEYCEARSRRLVIFYQNGANRFVEAITGRTMLFGRTFDPENHFWKF